MEILAQQRRSIRPHGVAMVAPQVELCQRQIENIAGFLGYGNPCNSVWFIGIEEGLGGATDEDAAKNLQVRGGFEKEIMDLYHAHHHRLRDKRGLIDFDVKPPSTQVWRWIARIMVAYGRRDWNHRAVVNEYVQSRLGRSGGETFLTELSPVPSRTAGDRALRGALEKRYPALNERIDNRKRDLIKLLGDSHPAMVICYGNGRQRARDFQEFFDVEWKCMGKGIAEDQRYKRPYHFLLLPFFGQGQMSCCVLKEMLRLGLLADGPA